ncbi:MAG TPA: hypothetical protein VII36_11135 [Usitatibacter sp.]
MSCEECRELQTHEFRSPADLLHAVQVAAVEVDRGVLARLRVEKLTLPEHEALESIFETHALPATVRYRFECTVCGDRFELFADTAEGTGGWTREERADAS